MNAKTITSVTPAAKPAKAAALDTVIKALEANIKEERSAEAQGFASLVAEHKADILRSADRAGTARDMLRSTIKLLAEYAAAHSVARIDAGRMLAQVLGFKNLMENKDIANAWQYAAAQAGLAGSAKGAGGKVSASGADKNLNPDKPDGEEGNGKVVAAQVPVKIAENATAIDVVSAFKAWAAKHKAQSREALEIIATWKAMVEVQAELAKAA